MSKSSGMSKKERREAAQKKAKQTRVIIIVVLVSVAAVMAISLVFNSRTGYGENGGSGGGGGLSVTSSGFDDYDGPDGPGDFGGSNSPRETPVRPDDAPTLPPLGDISDALDSARISADGVDYDFTELDGLIKFSAIMNVMNDPYLYESKTLRINGFNDPYYLDEAGKWYQFLRIEGDVCCGGYVMFRTVDDIYPDDFPPLDAPLTVTGVLKSYYDPAIDEDEQLWYLEVVDFAW